MGNMMGKRRVVVHEGVLFEWFGRVGSLGGLVGLVMNLYHSGITFYFNNGH